MKLKTLYLFATICASVILTAQAPPIPLKYRRSNGQAGGYQSPLEARAPASEDPPSSTPSRQAEESPVSPSNHQDKVSDFNSKIKDENAVLYGSTSPTVHVEARQPKADEDYDNDSPSVHLDASINWNGLCKTREDDVCVSAPSYCKVAVYVFTK